MTQRSLWDLFITYVARSYPRILMLTWQHLYISGIALAITLVICIPLGIYLTRNEKLAPYVIGLANVFQTIPSLALLGFLIFVFGIGNDNAIAALVLYAMLPVIQNTYTGLRNVPPSLIQAARGMGMTERQILLKVQLPLARPVLIAGIRVATVWVIGTATLAAAIGGGGLGRLIFSGLASIRNEVILAGAIPATILALLADQCLKMLENYYSPETRAKRLARLGPLEPDKPWDSDQDETVLADETEENEEAASESPSDVDKTKGEDVS
ncbi:MAG: ABC transporter permease [Synergistaceae bacterium]|nr:ABC transporter permease [Synergistaceae bacterium]